MATSASVAERRTKAVARLVEEAQWVAGDFGFKVTPPAAVKDVEIQRIGLLEYAADVLGAVRDARQAERQDTAAETPAENEPEADADDAPTKAKRARK